MNQVVYIPLLYVVLIYNWFHIAEKIPREHLYRWTKYLQDSYHNTQSRLSWSLMKYFSVEDFPSKCCVSLQVPEATLGRIQTKWSRGIQLGTVTLLAMKCEDTPKQSNLLHTLPLPGSRETGRWENSSWNDGLLSPWLSLTRSLFYKARKKQLYVVTVLLKSDFYNT